jgi:sulfate adenylyltransferase subunit 1
MKGTSSFSVQTVIRPKQKNTMILEDMPVAEIIVGDAVTVLPSLTESKVSKILFDKQFDEASVGSSITIELENDINVTRGDMIVKSSELPKIEKDINTTVCWMDSKN